MIGQSIRNWSLVTIIQHVQTTVQTSVIPLYRRGTIGYLIKYMVTLIRSSFYNLGQMRV